MKIRTRLQVSNFLMILVPVGIALLTGLLCLSVLYAVMAYWGGLGFDDRNDFEEASYGMVLAVEQALEADTDSERLEHLQRLSGILDENVMRLVVEREGEIFYNYGEAAAEDAVLRDAAAVLETSGEVTQGTRNLFAQVEQTGGETYYVCLYGSEQDWSAGFIEKMLGAMALILIVAILAALLWTNRFLTRFVFRKIEAPLDILAHGVQEIGAGNLDYRIEYKENDEFAPICAEFNVMAQRLKHSVEESQRQEESRKELMADISHDLRSPLTAIQAYVEGLLDGVAKTPEKEQAYLLTIKAKAEEIQRMVSQIFQFSKMDLENYPMQIEALDLREELTALLEVIGPEYAGKGLEVSTRLETVTVKADAELLRRVVVNILDNSLKYKTADIGHAELSLRTEGDEVFLRIADDGPGVPSEALPKLFDVFYRSDPARHNPNQGSGLGLSIVARAVQRLNGRVSAELCEPQGLAIVIVLPKGDTQNE